MKLFKKKFSLFTKKYLRSTIGEYRLNGLIFLNIYMDIKVTLERVIEEFIKKNTLGNYDCNTCKELIVNKC